MTFLLDLPTEILVAILLKLDLRDLYTCQQVSPHTRAVIEASCVIQYKIHLAAFGAVDGAGSGLAVADRLARLKAHQRAWRYSELLPHPEYPWISSDPHDEGRRPLVEALPFSFRGPLTAWLDGSKLRLSQPYSPTRSAPASEWSVDLDHAGMILHSGVYDSSQRTVALLGRDKVSLGLCFQIYLLRPDGKMIPHSLSASRSCAVAVPGDSPRSTLSGGAISGDLVTCSLEEESYVYNWKTGRVVLIVDWEHKHLQFLNENTLLAGKRDEICVYIVDPYPSQPPAPPAELSPTCILQLPQSADRIDPPIHSIHSLQCCVPQDATGSCGPFQDDPSAALVVLSFSRMENMPAGAGYVFCIPRDPLLARIAAAVRAGCPVLPWHGWALEDTLLLRLHETVYSYSGTRMSLSAAGSRMVLSLMPRHRDAPDPAPVVLNAFVCHVHAEARTAHRDPETAESARRAAQYFDVVPASTLGQGPALGSTDARSLPYEIYHKSISMTAEHAGGRADGILWLSTLFEDGLVVARTAYYVDDTVNPQKLVSKLTHAYMFAT